MGNLMFTRPSWELQTKKQTTMYRYLLADIFHKDICLLFIHPCLSAKCFFVLILSSKTTLQSFSMYVFFSSKAFCWTCRIKTKMQRFRFCCSSMNKIGFLTFKNTFIHQLCHFFEHLLIGNPVITIQYTKTRYKLSSAHIRGTVVIKSD